MAEEEDKKKKKGPPTEILPNKQILPLIGFGTYKLKEEKQITDLLRKGLQLGYCKHIDGARMYNNQIQLGKAIQTVISENRVKREELFITTKIFNHVDSSPIMQLKEVLQLMQLKYIDLLYVHWPVVDMENNKHFRHKSLEQLWEDMELCVTKGYAKHLGVSNFNGQALAELLTFAKIKPIALQIEVHPYLQNTSLVELAQKNGIIVLAHTPLVRGDNLDRNDDVNILKDEVINEIAAKHGKTPAQIVLKSNLTRGIGVIPKTSNINRLQQNYESWTVQLGEDDMKKIRPLNRNYRVCAAKGLIDSFCVFD